VKRDRKKPLFLVAGTQPAFAVLREALEGSAELLVAESLSRAAYLLGARVDLVVCTLRFDESRMFDFLRLARAAAPGVPIACCRLLDAQLSDLAVDAVAVAARAAGADDYLDLVGLQREHGIEAGNAAFREALLRLALRPAA
jgi:hypothetical protein